MHDIIISAQSLNYSSPFHRLPLPPQMDQQQHDEPEGQQEPPAVNPEMSNNLFCACVDGNVDVVSRCLDAGESVNCVHQSTWRTPIMIAMTYNRLHVVQLLADMGADLSMVDSRGFNLLHYAALGGKIEGIEWVLANTTIDVNSTATSGTTPTMRTLLYNALHASKLLIEKGANLFTKNNDGERVIDVHVYADPDNDVLGPQVLRHALDLRWSSVKQLVFISNFYETSDVVSASSSSSSAVNIPQHRSFAASVFTISGLVRHIAEYLTRTELIVRDPAIKKKDQESDDVKRRVEAMLAADEESNKNKRNRM
jgi:hypothetical protein